MICCASDRFIMYQLSNPIIWSTNCIYFEISAHVSDFSTSVLVNTYVYTALWRLRSTLHIIFYFDPLLRKEFNCVVNLHMYIELQENNPWHNREHKINLVLNLWRIVLLNAYWMRFKLSEVDYSILHIKLSQNTIKRWNKSIT